MFISRFPRRRLRILMTSQSRIFPRCRVDWSIMRWSVLSSANSTSTSRYVTLLRHDVTLTSLPVLPRFDVSFFSSFNYCIAMQEEMGLLFKQFQLNQTMISSSREYFVAFSFHDTDYPFKGRRVLLIYYAHGHHDA